MRFKPEDFLEFPEYAEMMAAGVSGWLETAYWGWIAYSTALRGVKVSPDHWAAITRFCAFCWELGYRERKCLPFPVSSHSGGNQKRADRAGR